MRRQGDGFFYLDSHRARPAALLKPFTGEVAHSTYAGTHSTHTHGNSTARDGRRSPSPDAYARGGSLSPDFARGGSLSPDFPHGDSTSPDSVRAGFMSVH
ncbi:hypothetical protein C8R44DRAFT_806123 [Mycena epipterygia]|nr:hypothetical protein C8R44DRAFT_806123 [Mycena epipterygia]